MPSILPSSFAISIKSIIPIPQSQAPDSWYKLRDYIHFDRRISKKFALSYVTDPDKIETHAFLPFLKYVKVIPRYKSDKRKTVDKERPILYASHLDSHIYAWYARQLSVCYEEFVRGHGFNQCILAYRSLGKSNVDFAKEVFDKIEQKRNCTALAFDVAGFFDNIDHAKLKSAWCEVLGVSELPRDHYKVYRSITKYAYVERNEVLKQLGISDPRKLQERGRLCTPEEFRNRIRANSRIKTNPYHYGIPQGSPISAVLSNIFLIHFDRIMSQRAIEINGIYQRYCDDILWICLPTEAENIKELVNREIRKCGDALLINSDKAEVSEFYRTSNNLLIGSPPLQYLGFIFDGQKRLLRPQTLSRYYRRMKGAVRIAGQAAFQAKDIRIHRRTVYEKYSHLGRRSFIGYAIRASETMGSIEIRQQVRNHWEKLHEEIEQVETYVKEKLEAQEQYEHHQK